jgi:hypothetical protein
MNYKTTLPVLALIIMLAACNNAKSPVSKRDTENISSTAGDSVSPIDALTILRNVFNKKTDSLIGDEDVGREVAMDSALQCIAIYEPEMYRHAIELNPGRARAIGTINSRKITKHEDFAGDMLLEWMLKMVRILDPEGNGNNVGFQLHMGIYTDEFLRTYHPDQPDVIEKKRNRITIFIIPYGKGTMQLKNEDEITAFELGGLRP